MPRSCPGGGWAQVELTDAQSVQLHINICKLMPRLPKIHRHFLTAVSQAFRQIYQTKKEAGKKSTFFDFEERGN